MFRGANSVAERTKTLKSPMNASDLVTMWKEMPGTRHPLTDASKWNFDTWVLDGEGADTKVCAVIQGEFEERKSSLSLGTRFFPLLTVTGPSGILRSFSRTFILTSSVEGSP